MSDHIPIADDPHYASRLAAAFAYGRFLPNGVDFEVFSEKLSTMNMYEQNAVRHGMLARARSAAQSAVGSRP